MTTAAPILHRIRQLLDDSIDSAQVPAFTAGIGLVDSTWSNELPALLRSADRALRDAKDQGRDRVIIDHDRDPMDEPSPVASAAVQLPAPVLGTAVN